jgi:ATP-dependent helicase HrpB
VGALLFDEFHERSIHADFGLALALQTQELLRPELRILVMSATLDGAAVASLLGGSPIVTSEGRIHPVEIRHLPSRRDTRIEDSVATAVRAALARDEGSILAFLPGAPEIRRCLGALQGGALPGNVRVMPLYGDLPPAAQDDAIAPAPLRERKVVLATSIAETSLTIDGVRVVVDGGLSRVPRFSPRTGMTRLETVRVTRSSANQRAGRAGRTAPGVCYRLWTPEEDAHLADGARPEILEADLASLALDLAAAGVADAAQLRWLDTPPEPALAQARALLLQLGALDSGHRITAHGRAMAAFGLHPRLAHMLLLARSLEHGATACLIAALLEERDVFRRDAKPREVDLRSRLAVVADSDRSGSSGVDHDAVRRVREQSRRLRDQLRVPTSEAIDEGIVGVLLAFAYPERVAQRRTGGGYRYLLRNGMGAALNDPGGLAGAPYLAVADLDGRSPQAQIYLAAPLDLSDLQESFGSDIEQQEVVTWDGAAGAVVSVRRDRLGAIVLRESSLHTVDPELLADALLAAIASNDGLSLAWSDAARRIRERIAFLRANDPSWPDLSDDALHATLNHWLRPHLMGLRRRADIERLPLDDILLGIISWEQRRQLDELAPTHLVVPTGSRIAIDYADPSAPVLAVRLQEMFGLAETPRIAGGRVTLTLRLLSPAHRPVQVTRDLAGFWKSSYFAVRKDLRGRYPKHEWPDDPISATPTRRAKPRS